MNKLIKSLLAFLSPSIIGFAPSKRTVNGALVHFNRALDELKAVEAQENKEAEEQEQALAEAAAKLAASRREAARARSKQAKIVAFIGDDEDEVATEGVQSLRSVQFN